MAYATLGDSCTLLFPLRFDGAPYDPAGVISAIATCKRNAATDEDTAAVFQYATGFGLSFVQDSAGMWNAKVDLLHTDTKSLTPALPYAFDVQVQEADGRPKTVVLDTITFRRDVTRQLNTSVAVHTAQPGVLLNGEQVLAAVSVAEAAAVQADDAADRAAASEGAAAASAGSASTAATAAQGSATTASTEAAAAQTSAMNAAASAGDAMTSAGTAGASATQAVNSAGSAAASASAAETHKTAAQGSATAAAASATAADASKAAAASSATSAGTSATQAANSATAAAGSATAASGSATAAAGSATQAANSATAAAQSATDAANTLANKLDKSGGTVTGLVAIKPASGNATLEIDAVTAGQAELLLKKNGINAWKIVAGTDGKLRLNQYNQTTGALINTVLVCDEVTGDFTSGRNWTIQGFTANEAALFSSSLTTNGAATFNSTAQFNNTVFIGSDTASQALRFNGPAGAAKGVVSWRTLGALRSQVYMDSSENIKWDDYGDSAEYLRTWLTHNRLTDTTTLTGSFSADTITNYASDVSVSALLALSAAASAKKRIASVTGAYRLDGTIGRVLAQWDGDASAGTWRISGSGVAVTADRLTFARSIRTEMPGKRQVRNGVSIQQFECGSVVVSGSAGINNTTGAFPYSSQLWANEANARINAQLQSMWNYPGSGMRYVSARIILPRLSTAGNPFASIVRLCQNQQGIGANECGAIYDPQDIYGFGFGASVGAYSKGPTNTTTSPGAFSPAIWTDYLVEIALTGTSVRIYVNGALVGDISTNMPSDSVCLTPQVCFHRGAAASEGIDSLMMEFTAIDIH